jgi:hypothetical protein
MHSLGLAAAIGGCPDRTSVALLDAVKSDRRRADGVGGGSDWSGGDDVWAGGGPGWVGERIFGFDAVGATGD